MDVKVETFKGTVQLNGFVDTSASKERASTVAKNTKGVTAVRNNLTDAGVDDFASTGLPFASSDFTGGQQWNLVIAPGASQTVRAAFSVNMTALAPALCRADFNGDAAVNSQDFFDFLAAFFVTAPRADFNGDTAINSQVFFDFLTEFFAGCP